MERAFGDLVSRVRRRRGRVRGATSARRKLGVIGAMAVAAFSAGCTTTQAPDAAGGAREPTGSSAGTASTGVPTSASAGAITGVDGIGTAGGNGVGAAKGEQDADAGAGSNASGGTALEPLEGELIRLSVAGFRDAVVSVPTGATGPRPVVLALHGNFDRPEWQCEVWRGVTRRRAFVVCPRGIPRPDAPKSMDRWTYGKGTDVRAEVEAALGAVRARFDGYIASGPILYTGFSLGAIHGVGIVASDGQRYPRAVLVEGGHDGWTTARAKAYAAAGGKRVLFACGQRACKTDAAQARKNLQREGVETELVFGGEVGHTYDGPVASEIARVWTWLVADDPRWTDG